MKNGIITVASMSLLFGSACSFNQAIKDWERFDAIQRGSEVYELPEGADSWNAGSRWSAQEIAFYNAYSRIFREEQNVPEIGALLYYPEAEAAKSSKAISEETGSLEEIAAELRALVSRTGDASIVKSLDRIGERLEEVMARPRPDARGGNWDLLRGAGEAGSGRPGEQRKPEVDVVWGADAVVKGLKTTSVFEGKGKTEGERQLKQKTTEPMEQYIHALSSTASVAQMRDLITEPAFPHLLPVKRKVKLGCLPPPESAAFEAVAQLTGKLNYKEVDAEFAYNYATSVAKLFEETERTIFLQYALFRLCEMGVNSPAGFRNVHPIIMHDLVRRSAEMKQEALKETEMRRSEEAKALQIKRQAEVEQKKVETEEKKVELEKAKVGTEREKVAALRESKFLECVTARTKDVGDDAAKVDAARTICKKIIESSAQAATKTETSSSKAGEKKKS